MIAVYRALRDAVGGCLVYSDLRAATGMEFGQQGHSIMLLRSKGVGITAHVGAGGMTAFALTEVGCSHIAPVPPSEPRHQYQMTVVLK